MGIPVVVDLKPFTLIMCFAIALALSLLNFLTMAAVLPELIAAWGLNKTQAGWLVSVYFAGYMSSILLVAAMTDRIDPRKIYLTGAFLGGVSSLSVALFADGFWLTVALRFLGGIAFSGIYMPGLRALTDSLPSAQRNRGIVYYTSCFALGSGFSIFAAGQIADALNWRWAFGLASMGSFLALVIVAIVLKPRARSADARPENAPAQPALSQAAAYRQVWRNKKALAYILAMYGVGWEVFAFRSWIVTYLTERQASDLAVQTFWLSPADIAFVTAIMGIPAAVWIGEWAARMSREKLLLSVAGLSLIVDILLAWSVSWPFETLLFFACVFSLTSFGRSSATTAGMMAAAEERVRGATMAAYSFVAFLAGITSPLALGLVLDGSVLALGHTSWTIGFLAIATGSLISIAGYWIAARAGNIKP